MSEPSLDLPDHGPGGLHPTYPPSPPLNATDAFSGALRSLSLKAASRRGGDHMTLQPLRSEGGPPTPHRGLFAPHALPNRNGSLSYDSLLNPGSPSSHACPTHPSVGMAGYHSPYLHPGPSDPPRPPPHSFSPVLGPRPREPSPVRYDNLSRTIMASIQERKDREERERLLRSQTDSLFGDSGVYDTPSSYSLQQASVLTEGPRGSVLRYGSRDDLVAGPGFGGARNPALQTSLSSLSSSMSRAPRTSSSSLQADQANNNAPGPRPGSGSHRSPARQGLPSPPGTPRSPSYTGSKAVAFIHTDLPDRPPSLAMQRWVSRSVDVFPHSGPQFFLQTHGCLWEQGKVGGPYLAFKASSYSFGKVYPGYTMHVGTHICMLSQPRLGGEPALELALHGSLDFHLPRSYCMLSMLRLRDIASPQLVCAEHAAPDSRDLHA